MMYGHDSIYKYLMIKYGELGLKGKNKQQFINRLVRNIEFAVESLKPRKVTATWGRIMVPVGVVFTVVVARILYKKGVL